VEQLDDKFDEVVAVDSSEDEGDQRFDSEEDPEEVIEKVPHSPPCKRTRYGEPGSRTLVQLD
jgi:hypothetical protein